MRYTTRTEYGLMSLVHMALSPTKRVTIKELSELECYSSSYIEKIFQSLRSAHIVDSFQGNQGGYALAREPKDITLKHIIEALEGETFEVFCECHEVICNHPVGCSLKGIWKKTKGLLDEFYGSITLQDLAHQQRGAPQPFITETQPSIRGNI
ncbi:MAG: hypothetical protein A3I05_00805 [Deltaproteobacteria bacterium RIFCSPLOWO2_02_FULL_44_10]|nr:MAG: hypothetical protein A3C46_03300 [Deltaproteobacteria bacterium RIFCSPHIGHO2_02_FULL_44_16]OGQ45052.1 MAG: hypothetical protein A3I05_00805 [Deltaproteobacteria bacterium RIFCSPLOWO2_02_FULL_44_10]